MITAKPDGIYYYLLFILSATMLTPLNFIAYGLMAALLLWSFAKKEFQTKINESWLYKKEAWLPALIYVITIICFFISNNQKAAFKFFSAYLPYLFPLIISIGPAINPKQFKTIIRAVIIGITVSIFVCILYALTDIVSSGENKVFIEDAWYSKLSSYGLTRLFPSWHPSFAGTFAAWAFSFMIGYRVYYKNDPLFNSFTELCLGIVLITGIILMNSIAAIIALLFGLILIFIQWLTLKKVKPIVIAAIIIITFTITGFTLFVNPFNNSKIESLKTKELIITDNENDRNFLTIRMAKWVNHLEIFKNHPLLGVTPADIKQERKEIYEKNGFTYLALHNYNAHNQYIETLCRFGILGLVILISFMIYPICLKYISSFYKPFILIAAIAFLTESFLERQQGLLAFMCLFALLVKTQKDS